MKIEIYVRNKDLEATTKHLKKFLDKYLKNKSKIELKKVSQTDIINGALSDSNYRRIVKLYTHDNSPHSALNHLLELYTKDIFIWVAFKYSNFGNLVLINRYEIKTFIEEEETRSHEAVEKLYK